MNLDQNAFEALEDSLWVKTGNSFSNQNHLVPCLQQ